MASPQETFFKISTHEQLLTILQLASEMEKKEQRDPKKMTEHHALVLDKFIVCEQITFTKEELDNAEPV